MLSTFTVIATVEFAGLSPSIVVVPANSLNAPRTLVTMAWRATKPIRVCAGSRVYWPVSLRKSVVVAVMRTPRAGWFVEVSTITLAKNDDVSTTFEYDSFHERGDDGVQRSP